MKNSINRKSLWVAGTFCWALTLPAQAQLMIYPMKGQTADQQSRDQYECHMWAVQQSGFDPSTAQAAPAPAAEPQQKGKLLRGGMRGAAAGAAIGAIAGDAGKGAAIGATAGGMKGAFNRIDEKKAAQTQAPAASAGQDAYNRAIQACLSGRGYSVN